jgi:hypothetical protein
MTNDKQTTTTVAGGAAPEAIQRSIAASEATQAHRGTILIPNTPASNHDEQANGVEQIVRGRR